MDKEIYINVLKNHIVKLNEENLILNTLLIEKTNELKKMQNCNENDSNNKDLE